MARLPNVGGDDNDWGDILNAFLEVAHNADGTLQTSAITTAGGVSTINGKTPSGGSVNLALADMTDVNGASSASNNQVLAWSSVSSKWVPSTVSSTTVNDATTSNKGIVQLAGDLAGTATSPTVPGLAAKADDSAVVHNTGNENVGGVKTFTSAPVVPSSSFPESAITNLTTDLTAKATDSTVVHNTGNENIAGTKTFTSAPVVPSSSFPESAVTNLTSDLAATEKTANKDVANGYAGLDSNTLLKVTEMPRALGIVVDLGTNNTGTVTCDLSLGIAFKVVLTTNTTISFTNWPASGLAEPEVYTIQDVTGGHSISLPSVIWEPTGSPPTFSTGANAVNIIPVASFDAGTTIYGITGLQGPAGTNGAAGPGICTFSMSGSLSTATGASRQYFESSFTIDKVRASVGTAPVGSSLTIDIIKNGGSSILSSPLSVTAGNNTATTTSFASSSLSANDYLTVNVTAVGSSTPGADLTVTVTVH